MADFNQTSFSGGMNLLVEDTRCAANEYREAFNVRNRFDILDQILVAEEQIGAPPGNKQGLYTFGDYMLLFVSGSAWFKYRDSTGWSLIDNFNMDPNVVKYYIEVVPVSTTLSARKSSSATGDPSKGADLVNPISVASTIGSNPGIIIQDGINQPYFIWIDNTGVHSRQTQDYIKWTYDPTGVDDRREYVPIGLNMKWMDGILFMLAPDGATLLRSCSGRPLDFVVNVDKDGNKGGDAYTSAYSVGVGGITNLQALSSGGLFVAAGNNTICFLVTLNRTPNAPTLWGEPTFIRQILFTAGCVNDRCFVDILGDSAFIDPEGLRSFNAVLQLQNEGRNSIFSLKVAKLFKGIIQDSLNSAAIIYDNYALFGVNTIYGYVIVVYDTLNRCFSSIDTVLGGLAVKQFAKIDTNTTQLYCITNDDRLFKLYSGTTYATSTVRFGGLCSQDPSVELQPTQFRCVLSGFRQDSSITCSAFVNNRLSGQTITKTVKFVPSSNPYTGTPVLSDADSQVNPVMFNFTGANQGWKMFHLMTWTGGGSITNVKTTTNDVTTINPLLTQAVSGQ